MADKFEEMCEVLGQMEIADGIFDLTIQTKEIAKHAKAGQFASLYCGNAARLLPRPISLCGIDREAGRLRFVYRVAGKGTEEFSSLKAGDSIRVLGPLGNGFPAEEVLPEGKRVFLIGGGIGIPPMLQLAKELKILDKEVQVQAVLGYRDSQTFLLEEFKEQCEVFVASEDGSIGTRGNVLDAIREQGLRADLICACGPTPMLRALKTYAKEQDIPCYISLEERMACGIGACLACVCKTKEKDAHTNVNNARICKEGPVFLAEEVEL